MRALKLKVLKIVRSSERALTVREICCAVNNVDKDFCMNIDGRGGRCVWFYRRPKHEKQAIRLVKPPCKHRAIEVIIAVNKLVKEGLLRRSEVFLLDRLSTWGMDRHVLIYSCEKQLTARFNSHTLYRFLHDRAGTNRGGGT